MNETWEQQKARLEEIARIHGLSVGQMAAIRAALARLESQAELVAIAERLFNRWSNSRLGSVHRVIDDQDATELRAALAHAATQEPVKLPLGHKFVQQIGWRCAICPAGEAAHAAPSVGDKPKESTCSHGYPQTVCCSRCGE